MLANHPRGVSRSSLPWLAVVLASSACGGAESAGAAPGGGAGFVGDRSDVEPVAETPSATQGDSQTGGETSMVGGADMGGASPESVGGAASGSGVERVRWKRMRPRRASSARFCSASGGSSVAGTPSFLATFSRSASVSSGSSRPRSISTSCNFERSLLTAARCSQDCRAVLRVEHGFWHVSNIGPKQIRLPTW